MRRIWPCLYLALFTVAFLCGLGAFGRGYGPVHVGWIYVSVTFLSFLFFPYGVIAYARARTACLLPRAAFTRGFSGGWWTDPLQCLRVSILLLGGYLLGALFTVGHTGHQGITVIVCLVPIFLGLLAGELIALKTFRDSITGGSAG